VEGLHRGQAGGTGQEVVVHNAFTLVSYDDKAKRYRFQAFTGRGNYEDAEAKVSEGQLVWGMKVPQFGDVRYTIKLDEKGRWFEVGEGSQDGKEWRKDFEMTLERVESKWATGTAVPKQRLRLTGAAILVFRASTSLQAAPAAEPKALDRRLRAMAFHIREARDVEVPALARLHVETFNETHRGGRSGGPS